MTQVKVCGLMNSQDIEVCVQAGVDAVGLVVDFPVLVPWNLTEQEARVLIKRVPPSVCSWVVTGGPVEKVVALAQRLHPDVVQLHYQEKLGEVEEIAQQLNRLGISTVKALRLDGVGSCAFEITDPVAAARALAATGITALLVDSYTTSQPGGTGVAIDLEIFKSIQQAIRLPLILAGGLKPANIEQVLQKTSPVAIDILTGVEEYPGKKNPEKIYQLMQMVKR